MRAVELPEERRSYYGSNSLVCVPFGNTILVRARMHAANNTVNLQDRGGKGTTKQQYGLKNCILNSSGKSRSIEDNLPRFMSSTAEDSAFRVQSSQGNLARDTLSLKGGYRETSNKGKQ